eukprot:20402-Heterococcus_DN1.PRE.1
MKSGNTRGADRQQTHENNSKKAVRTGWLPRVTDKLTLIAGSRRRRSNNSGTQKSHVIFYCNAMSTPHC